MTNISWSEANELIGALGAEDNLAARIGSERKARGWSQDELARQMEQVGHPIGQSAISKIEKPPPTGRRAITVSEAVGFAKVFDLALIDLLLPANALSMAEALKDLAQGASVRSSATMSLGRYENLIERLHTTFRRDKTVRSFVEDRLAAAIDRTGGPGPGADDSIEVAFLREVVSGKPMRS